MRIRRIAFALILASGLAAFAPNPAWGAGRGEPGPVLPMKVMLPNRLADLKLLHDLDIDIDGVFGTWARIYVLPEEMEKLTGLGFGLSSLAPESAAPVEAPFTPVTPFAVPTTYHTYETLTSELQQIAAAHPSIVRLHSLGLSVQGRNLWMVKISNKPDLEEEEPEVRFIAAMHGDEVVGKEMCVNLINLLVAGYGTDPRLTALIDQTEIWILPSMNPDGTALVQRYNANNVDLNRNFPDQFDNPVDSPAGRALETQHVMNWGYGHSVNLSANMHGGALVASYAYDGTASGASVYSLAPDDALWESLARTYADRNLPMRGSNSDPSFTNGVCNGADWYHINGSMQDWNYVWRGGKDLTLEISNSKWPAGSQLPQFWDDNRESMLTYLERAREGLHGVVRDAATGAPLAATIHIGGNARDTLADPEVGDYHRLLLPGAYTVDVSAPGYSKAHFDDVLVPASELSTRLDVDLTPLAANLQAASFAVLDGGNGALDPGETSDLSVSLQTLGSAASGISAELVPCGWAAAVVRSQATHQDVAVGGLGSSNPPHYAVSLSPLAPPGSFAGFALRWSASEGSGTSAPFFVPVGTTTCTTTASTNVPKAIADRQTATSTLTVAGDRRIDDVNVFVNVAHPYIGDLHVRVISPDGVPAALHSRTGGSADNIQGWYDTALTPSEPLTRLRGGHAAGLWTLEVEDGVPLNTGNILGWSVQVCGRPFETTLPPMKIRDVAKNSGGIDVRFWAYPSATSYRVYRSSNLRSPGSFTDVTLADDDATDTTFHDDTPGDVYWLVSGINASGEGPIAGP